MGEKGRTASGREKGTEDKSEQESGGQRGGAGEKRIDRRRAGGREKDESNRDMVSNHYEE